MHLSLPLVSKYKGLQRCYSQGKSVEGDCNTGMYVKAWRKKSEGDDVFILPCIEID